MIAEDLGNGLNVAPSALCVEFFHTSSLIAADLPCMDNDDLRRGKPTLHKVYNEGHALLTGDYLLTHAFQLLCEAPHLTAEQKVDLIHTLSQAIGGNGMVGGQVVDIASEGKPLDWDTLHFMHSGKTASLIATSFEFGAIIANAPTSDRSLLRNAGTQLGLAFQIIDDILDHSDSPQKASAVSLLGQTQAQSTAEQLLKSACDLISQLSVPATQLLDLANKLIFRKN